MSKENFTHNLKHPAPLDFLLHLREGANGNHVWTEGQIQTALLADVLRELRQLNELLHCRNFTTMPATIRKIDWRLTKHAPLRSKK